MKEGSLNIEVTEGISTQEDLTRVLKQETLWLSQLGRAVAIKHLLSSGQEFCCVSQCTGQALVACHRHT